MSVRACPEDEALSAFADGRASGSLWDVVHHHLDGCPACRRFVAAVACTSQDDLTDESCPTPWTRTLHPEDAGGVFAPGERLGRYVVDSALGRGAMGVVLDAFDSHLKRHVALKLIRQDLVDEDGSFRDRLRQEARALARLAHPNIVPIYDIGVSGSKVFLTMERVEGELLERWSVGQGWRRIVRCMAHAGRGLAAAHSVGIVHRDFKPANVIVGLDGRPRVMDFGLATNAREATVSPPSSFHESWQARDRTGAIAGTPVYLAPEVWAGESASPHSDQFAFFVTLFELLTGRRPFRGRTIEELRDAMAGGPTPVSTRDIPRALRRMVERGLSADPADRFDSMDDVAERLEVVGRRSGRWRLYAAGAAALATAGAFVFASPAPHRCAEAEPVAAPGTQAAANERLKSDPALLDGDRLAIKERLDDFAARWQRAHLGVCSSAGEVAPEEALVRNQCLAQQRVRYAAALTLVADADVPPINLRAVTAALPAPMTCVGLHAGDAATPVPEELADAVLRVREHLALAEAALYAGRVADAFEHHAAARRAGDGLMHPATEAETMAIHGKVLLVSPRPLDARPVLEEAYGYAVEHGEDVVAANVASSLMALLGNVLHDFDAAEPWADAAWASAQRSATLDDDANYLALHASMLKSQMKLDAARDEALRGSNVARRAWGTNSYRLAVFDETLGEIALRQADYDEAETRFEDAISASEAAYGGGHDVLYRKYLGLTNVALGRKEFQQAAQLAEISESILRENRGTADPSYARILRVLATIAHAEGDFERASSLLRSSRDILEGLDVDHPDIPMVLATLGHVLGTMNHCKDAEVVLNRALTGLQEVRGSRNLSVASVEHNLAECKLALGNLEGARSLFSSQQQTYTVVLGPDAPQQAYPLIGLGEVERVRGRPDVAQALLERALDVLPNEPAYDRERSHALAHLAIATWATAETADDRLRAVERGFRAQAILHRDGDGGALARELDAWLETR